MAENEKVRVDIFTQNSPIGEKGKPQPTKTLTDGTDTDTFILANLFKETMNVEVKPHHNMKKQELQELIEGIRDKCEVYFFVFLTYLHDEDQTTGGIRIQCYDAAISLEEIFDLVKDKPPFIGKQKIFLVQADDPRILGGATKAGGFDGEETPFPVPIPKIPTDCDRLMMFSTLPQQFSSDLHTARQITSGVETINLTDGGKAVTSPSDNSPNPNDKASLLVAAFDEVLRAALADEALRKEDLLTQTTRINGSIYLKIKQLNTLEEFEDKKFQFPLVTSTLRKQVCMLDYRT